MNDTNNNNNVTPYKASGNLNTMLNNPSANINNTMNVNIQNVNEPISNSTNNTGQNVVPPITNVSNSSTISNTQISNKEKTEPVVDNQGMVNVSTTNNVNRTFVNDEPKKQKKTVKITYSQELKIAVLIVVLLLVFLMFIPVIENFFRSFLH